MAEPTKSELIATLRAQRDEVLTKLRAMPAEAFEQGRYENGWNARQILAHVASIEWTYKRLVEQAVGGSTPGGAGAAASQSGGPDRQQTANNQQQGAGGGGEPERAQTNPAQPTTGTPMIDDYNARQVAKREGASVAELLDEFEKNRAATIAAVESADEALLSTPTRSAGGAQGTLAAVIEFVAVQHVGVHMRDIAGGNQEP
jgi:hypothetical protein